MRPFITVEGVAAPLPRANIDTDMILAGRFLTTITRAGLGRHLFHTLRQDPDFILNRPPWTQARILIALENFGSGSSREHAPWALADFGIRCVAAPSFADIFHTNCLKNGLLPVRLERPLIDRLMALASVAETARMRVDLPSQTIVAGSETTPFHIDPRAKRDLLSGADDIEKSLALAGQIETYEVSHSARLKAAEIRL